MEKQIIVKREYTTLNKIIEHINESPYQCSIEYDSWEVRTDSNGQMEQCLLIKKSAMHGMKIHFVGEYTLKINYIIPNKLMNAYFGKSQKKHKNIIEVLTGKISQAILFSSQKKAFNEIENVLSKKIT